MIRRRTPLPRSRHSTDNSQNNLPDSTIVAGGVTTQAMMICQTTPRCTPAPDPKV
jgi:hypothetical protein